MRSIRRDLSRSLLWTLGLVLLFGGLLAYAFTRYALSSNFNGALATTGHALAALVEFENGGFELEFSDEILAEFERDHTPNYFEVWDERGAVVTRSASLHGADLARSATGANETISELTLPDGAPGRAIAIRFLPHLGEVERGLPVDPTMHVPKLELVLARNRVELDAALASFARSLFATGAFLLLAIWITVAWRVRRGLACLDELSFQVARIDASSLGTRIAVDAQPLELAPVTARLNQALERLEQAFARERRFSAAAAHELRTPVAELKTLAEVALRWPVQGGSAGEARYFTDVRDIACQIEGLIEALLVLARSGRRALDVDRAAFALGPAAGAVLQALFTTVRERALRVQVDVPYDLVVSTHGPSLDIVLRNLIHNALEHAPNGSDVTIRGRRTADRIDLSISNDAAQLDESDLGRLFEPFWRKDEARTDGRHHGLGLSIVRALADPLGWTIGAALEPEGRITLTLSIPDAAGVSRDGATQAPRPAIARTA